MRLLFFGDLAATGFGTVTYDLGRELLNLGLDVRFISQNDLPDLGEPFRSRTVDAVSLVMSVEGGGTVVSGASDVIPDLILGRSKANLLSGEEWGDWKPEACLVLGDFMAARIFAEPLLAAFAQVPTFHYVPVEGVDLPKTWARLWSVLQPVAMSRFGQHEIARVTGSEPPLVYHGVDAATFRPVSATNPLVLEVPQTSEDGKEAVETKRVTLSSKAACKMFFGGDPRQTWILRTDRHMPRKNYNALIRAMAPVLEEHEDARLVLHCQPFDEGGYLPDTLSKVSHVAQERTLLTRLGGIPRDLLVALYNAADLYVSTSAEGFGLTIAEALACGVPAVALDYSAVPEVVGPAGTLVSNTLIDNRYDHFWAVPDEAEFGRAVSYLLDHPHKRMELGRRGPAHIQTNFRWDTAAQVFAQIFAPAPVVVAQRELQEVAA